MTPSWWLEWWTGPAADGRRHRLGSSLDRQHVRGQRRGGADWPPLTTASRHVARPWLSPTASRAQSLSCWPPCAARPAPEPKRHVPVRLARAGGTVVESLWTLTQGLRRGRNGDDPPLTRFLVEQLSTAHWFDQRLLARSCSGSLGSVWMRGSPNSSAGTRGLCPPAGPPRDFAPRPPARTCTGRCGPSAGLHASLSVSVGYLPGVSSRCAGSDEQRPERSPAQTSVRPCSMTRGGTARMSPSRPA